MPDRGAAVGSSSRRRMAFLTAILTHLEAPLVRAQLEYLHALAPDSRFLVCYGGAHAEFERLQIDDALFIEEESLRGPHEQRSHLGVLTGVYESRVRDDPGVELIYFIEFDHLILRADFEQSLAALVNRTGAGLAAKTASPRNETNWPHFLRYRDDDEVNRFVTRISRREDTDRRFGCLGTGMLLRREALQALCSLSGLPHAYVEMLVPTVIHHLGFEVVDVDMHSDLYARVSWRPEYGVEQAIAEKRAGRTFVHPFKQLDALDAIRAA
jgi:hypothetical protein